ncbi:hypothetical protein TrST_g14207 [Triparma strigata]|uniref:Purple acid phosphatase n=1 Tax=Triparma strigata TaxID=1606541 RepID=A0A9W7BXX3_9STRA|nr:hypothetical protein TrST_g14207 [Triparma strigata]
MSRSLAFVLLGIFTAHQVFGAGSPKGVHIAFAGVNSITISFYTTLDTGEDNLPWASIADKNFTGSTTKSKSRYHHDVIVSDLEPGEVYEYITGVGSASSEPFTFHMIDNKSTKFKTAFVGDMGVNNSQATIDLLTKNRDQYAWVHHVGDVSYADDFDVKIEPSSGDGYDDVYDLFQDELEKLAASTPYMVSPENHDVTCRVTSDLGCPEQQRNFSAFRERWRMPSIESGSSTVEHHNVWYSYRIGNAHFVSIDTESDFPNAPTKPSTKIGGGAGGGFGDQLGWLKNDLKEANEDESVDFIVAMGHRVFYSSSITDWPLLAVKHVKEAFEPIFHEYNVDLYVCGHKHFYERGKPSFEDKEAEGGTTQIINGAGGCNEGVQGEGKGKAHHLIAKGNYESTGYGELEVDGKEMTWRYILSESGSVDDEIVIKSRR